MSDRLKPTKNGPPEGGRNPEMPKLQGHSSPEMDLEAGIADTLTLDAMQKIMAPTKDPLSEQSTRNNKLNGQDSSLGTGQKTDQSCMELDYEDDNSGFTAVYNKRTPKLDPPTQAATKAHRIGIQINRTCTADSRISTDDMKNLFKIIASIDPNAIIMAANNQTSTAKAVTEMKTLLRMDFNGFMDVQTTAWGKPSNNMKCTSLSFG